MVQACVECQLSVTLTLLEKAPQHDTFPHQLVLMLSSSSSLQNTFFVSAVLHCVVYLSGILWVFFLNKKKNRIVDFVGMSHMTRRHGSALAKRHANDAIAWLGWAMPTTP